MPLPGTPQSVRAEATPLYQSRRLPSSRWRGTPQPSDDTVLHLQLSCLIKRGRTIRSKRRAIDPALKPMLIANSVQTASIGVLAQSSLPIITAPTLPSDQIIAIDAAEFASATGVPSYRASQNVTLHTDTVPSALSAVSSPNTVAAPMRSAFQTDVTALRSILPIDWALRRAGAGRRRQRRHLVIAMITTTQTDTFRAVVAANRLLEVALLDVLEVIARRHISGRPAGLAFQGMAGLHPAAARPATARDAARRGPCRDR